MITIICAFGTRPEAIKLAPVIRLLKKRRSIFRTVVLATAQHREMLDQVLDLFRIRPDYDLNLMTLAQSLTQITTRSLEGIEAVLRKEQPDAVLVQGDTTTALSGALAAFYLKIKVGHVEAGLRTDDKYAPFPEEINRRLITRLADFHFAPTEWAKTRLIREGVSRASVSVTGNTVIDALLSIKDKVDRIRPDIPKETLSALRRRDIVLVTGHRRESFGTGFENICRAIRAAADACPRSVFVYPVHLNPNVVRPVHRILGGRERIHLLNPLPYASFIWLMKRATIVLTDSGGVQEEAPTLGKPVLVMRDATERPEGIDAGNARLVGTDKDRIAKNLIELLSDARARRAMARVHNPYGDGRAGQRIVGILERVLTGRGSRRRPHLR